MSSSAEQHLRYRVMNAELRRWPFPHVFVEEAVPRALYADLLRHWPAAALMRPITELRETRGMVARHRHILPFDAEHLDALPEPARSFWVELGLWLLGPGLFEALTRRFGPWIDARFKDSGDVRLRHEALLVDDRTGYALGPHTDKASKVISALLYLPEDASREHLGTSLYVPRERGFDCAGGPHYPHDRFEQVMTMPYRPNCLFAFVKTRNSFHGVEPVTDADPRRRLLLYDVQVEAVAAAPERPDIEFAF